MNRLLDGLPSADLRRLVAACSTVDLGFADVLYSPGERLTAVYFPTSGFLSLIMPLDGCVGVEVGLVGNEGMFGIPIALGVDEAPVRVIVQGAGSAITLSADAFRRMLGHSRALQRVINRYAGVRLSQLAQTAACTRFHLVEARLARWLLMTQDRAGAPTFRITHAFLSSMLGVRRAGVTIAAGTLQRLGLIRYRRGTMTVLDRRRLKATSCGCYEADRAAYARLLIEPTRL